jgi:hypothetical protein
VPAKPPAVWRVKTNDGIAELCRNVGGPNVRTHFYAGFASFVKKAWQDKAALAHLGHVPQVPVGIRFVTHDTRVHTIHPPPLGGYDETNISALLAELPQTPRGETAYKLDIVDNAGGRGLIAGGTWGVVAAVAVTPLYEGERVFKGVHTMERRLFQVT